MLPPGRSCLFCEDILKRCCRSELRAGWEPKDDSMSTAEVPCCRVLEVVGSS